MKIIDQSFEIFKMPEATDTLQVLQHIEKVGRVCYKSEDKITDTSCNSFVEGIKKRQHWAVLEHYNFSLWIPEIIYMEFQKLKETLNDPMSKNCFKFINLTKLVQPKEEGKEFLISLSATTINYFWNHSPGAMFNKFINNLFSFITIDYPNMILVPSAVNILSVFDHRGIKYVTQEELDNNEISYANKYLTVKFITNRAIANEIVRHRVASFAQESTRYCSYNNDKFDNQITVIENNSLKNNAEAYEVWKKTLLISEQAYLDLIRRGIKPEVARDILPLDLKTELIMSASLFEWDHFIKLRTSNGAHPQIKELVNNLKNEINKEYPNLFE